MSAAPADYVTVYVKGATTATETSQNGRYTLSVPADEALIVVFSRVGYQLTEVRVAALPPGGRKQIDVALPPQESELNVVVRESKIEEAGMVREDPAQLRLLPSTTNNLESILPSIALGVSSGTGGELSSQYNVRGGNYDENLVYVNDFQIYRPQLIRQGQQEGLTFANPNLMRSLSFSSGGFEARYGDRLSSVLDIQYKRPDSTRASLEGSLLGASAHLEGSKQLGGSSYQRLRYLVGARYKTTSYLLGSLETTGEYVPHFVDLQTYLTYDLSRTLQLGVLANYNRSIYNFDPSRRESSFGGFFQTLRLSTLFSGNQRDDFLTQFTGASLTYIPERDRNPLFWKLLVSTYRSDENEAVSIGGDYLLGQVDTDLGSDNFGEIIGLLGTGTQQQWVRNFLDIRVSNAELRGGLEVNQDGNGAARSHFLQWGAKAQRELIDDRLNEWERLDSAGFSLPFNEETVELFSVLKTENELESNRLSAFFQDTYSWRREGRAELRMSGGLRATYWDLNGEFNLSPRAQLLYKPLGGTADITYKLAGGLYVQPPFYREMRAPNGKVNTDLRAQKSAHIVAGLTSDFYYGKRNPKKFRLITEAYYKSLWDLVSYEIDNVRIRYSGVNDASGYVAGIDMRLNGEFVPGADSWLNLSLLRVREQLTAVQHREIVGRDSLGEIVDKPVETVPRPTDNIFQLAMFFQDYLRGNPDFRTHVQLTVAGGLPFGIPGNNEVYRNQLRFRTYHRLDIGFSYRLFARATARRPERSPLRFTRSTFLSLEVFNMMNVPNQAGNTWIKTIFQQQYAVPNRLTGRRVNLRLRMEF